MKLIHLKNMNWKIMIKLKMMNNIFNLNIKLNYYYENRLKKKIINIIYHCHKYLIKFMIIINMNKILKAI